MNGLSINCGVGKRLQLTYAYIYIYIYIIYIYIYIYTYICMSIDHLMRHAKASWQVQDILCLCRYSGARAIIMADVHIASISKLWQYALVEPGI